MFFTQIVLLLSNSFFGRSKKFRNLCHQRTVTKSTHVWVSRCDSVYSSHLCTLLSSQLYAQSESRFLAQKHTVRTKGKWVYFRQLHFKKMKNLAFSCDNSSVALWYRILSYGKSVALMTAFNLSWKNEKANLFSCTHGCTLSRFIYLQCGKAKKWKKTTSK